MPFVLHPSGYCVYYHAKSEKNLKPGEPCLWCQRVAGHKPTCPLFVEKENECKSSRVKLFDRAAILWARASAMNNDIKFFTFTLPSLDGKKTFQRTADCTATGDIAVTSAFSKLLENCAINIKRHRKEKFSYVWVSEAQKKRQEKFGGVGDLHFHLVTDSFIPVNWLRDSWNVLLGTNSNNCVHVDAIPTGVRMLPNYLAKYMGKGTQRRIYSRRFSCSRDLSAFSPITFKRLPNDLTCEKETHFTTPKGFECSMYYFNTTEVLEQYGALMQAETALKEAAHDPAFTLDAIQERATRRSFKKAVRSQPECNQFTLDAAMERANLISLQPKQYE
jgi:hypothetical protein